MKQFKTAKIDTLVLDKIFCNMCGEEIPRDRFNELQDYLQIEKTWGYNSNHDGSLHKFDICIGCYEKLIKTFKIPV